MDPHGSQTFNLYLHLLHEMGRFLMWMVPFFTMAIFWKYMDFAWFLRKDKDFLQVQRGHCMALCNVTQGLEKSLKAMEASSRTKVLNKNQCVHLFRILILAMKGIDQMLSSASKDLKFQRVVEELCFLQRKVEIVGKSCIDQDRWCHSAVYQIQNRETFRELLIDLKCCYDTACEMYKLCHPNQPNNILSIEFDATTYDQVLEDGQDLKKRLELVPDTKVFEDYELVQHLLLRLRNLDRVDGGDLDALEFSNDFKTPDLIKEIGVGSYAHVYYSNWLGLPCAIKVLEGNSSFPINFQKEVDISEGSLRLFNNYLKEAGILAGLSHPNLVQFLGCGIKKRRIENNVEEEIDDMYLVMEPMETSLSTILEKAKRPFPFYFAMDIMHQIAKGVCYLHDMQVAHLDLKPGNVLSSPISEEDPRRIFKVTDYGTSQLTVCSNPKNPKPSKYTIGTLGYMAPEMMEGSKTPMYPFKADVWSFAMICAQILSRNDPYFDFKHQSTYGSSSKVLRPKLPNDCEGLTNLIQECWCEDPQQRPSFSEICERLTSLKRAFLKGTLEDLKSIVDHVLEVDEPIAASKEIPIVLDQDQLSRAKGLLKMNYVGIVGMGGIGKTTLAKAIFDDVIVKSLYHASCFVAECKSYQSSYDILCKILPELGNDRRPKDFGDAQEMMKELFFGKKILLILDDIENDSQVHDIVPPDVLETSKGSCIVMTTRNWNTIKSFVGDKGKLDVQLLDEKASTMLFTTHLSWGVAPLSPGFQDLRKHIVKACNGLPLSLKVLGAFLHNKKRLRSWERALHVMARGRNLEGDEEIWNTLQISFDGLNDGVEKEIFLDMACFFCRDVYPFGVSKETILSIWSQNGNLPVVELQRLIDMSLLKVSEDGDILEMHDQLRDMGRKISKDTRVWNASLIPEFGFSNKDVNVLQGISLQGNVNYHFPEIKEDQNLDFENLRVLILVGALDYHPQTYVDNLGFLLQLASQCSNLEAIIVEGSIFSYRLPHPLQADIASILKHKSLGAICPSLKILHLVGLHFLDQIPKELTSNPSLFRLNLSECNSLVALPKEVGNLSLLTTLNLNRCRSLVALPEEVGNLSLLTTLNLNWCYNLAALPKEVGNLSSLTTLNLNWCYNLAALPKEVGNLSSLTTLNLINCSKLAALPKEVGNLSLLTTLNLNGCRSLVALPKEVGNLSLLTTLDLNGCLNLATLPKKVGNLSLLITLDLNGCRSLVALPSKVGNLSSLTTLNLNGCLSLATLPKKVGNLYSLTTLNLNGCSSLVTLPKEVANLSSLTTLNLNGCSSLVTLPKEVGNLSSLTTLNLNGCSSLVTLPKEVGNLSFLTVLNLNGCSSLVTLPKEVEKLSFLATLDLNGCYGLVALPKEVGSLSSLTSLYLRGCSSLMALPEEVGNLSLLTTFSLNGCSRLAALPKEVGNLFSLTTIYLNECVSLVTLPKEVGNLSSLTTLNLYECLSLVALPKEVGNLSSLTTLNLHWCRMLEDLPKEVGNLSSLTTLVLNECLSLVTLPKEVGNLSSLTTLSLKRCSNFVDLPKEVGNLSSLTTLDLNGCSSLVTLPKEVGNLSSLNTLDLNGCSSLASLPKEVGNLSSLTTLDLSWCSSLVALPEEVENLSFLTTSDLFGCSSTADVSKEVGNLSSLTTIHLIMY